MEERYEIKGKIGQGGLGSVYKAHDVRMNREVAIKRIITNSEDASVPEEATRQLIKEAGALASLQHPNIVTVYDVGTDEDGPFVVMELLTGDTLEEIIGKGSFTWQDFRQLAMQTMEALIAAQELHLVHRDLKPGNIMLTWLPSGKFQVKIVDFGLAKLSAKPSLQTIDQSDGVFGSIYFMAPEQFERVPIDLRTDLYAVGCVFYYALTGTYPYDGETAAEVMASHLQHHVTPIQEVREGIPIWACDWIMWHINRQTADRPESARQSLQIFLDNDTASSSTELSTGKPKPTEEPSKRPKLRIPGSAPVPEVVNEPAITQPIKTATAPKPLAPPPGSKASLHTTSHVDLPNKADEKSHTPSDEPPEPSEAEAKDKPEDQENEPEVPTLARAKPVASSAPPALKKASSSSGTKSLVSASQPPFSGPPGTGPVTSETPDSPAAPAIAPIQNKKRLSNGVKMTIAVVLGIVAVLIAVVLLERSGKNAETKIFNEKIQIAAKDDATEVPVNKRALEILLSSAVSVASNNDRYSIYKALYLAKATDDTDVDARIAEFATTQEMVPDIRVVLIRDVLRKRKDPAVIGTLLDFAERTKESAAAVAAIEASRFMASDEHFDDFLRVLSSTGNEQIRKAAEENIAAIIGRSSLKAPLRDKLLSAYESAPNDTVKHSMLRLVGRIGGEKALALAGTNLESSDFKDKIAAIVALGNWDGDEGYRFLLDYLSSETDLQLRARAFDSAFQYANQATENSQEIWTLLAAQAKLQDEQLKLIRGLANVEPEPWAFAILQDIADNSDYEDAKDLAERAMIRLKDIQKLQSEDSGEEE